MALYSTCTYVVALRQAGLLGAPLRSEGRRRLAGDAGPERGQRVPQGWVLGKQDSGLTDLAGVGRGAKRNSSNSGRGPGHASSCHKSPLPAELAPRHACVTQDWVHAGVRKPQDSLWLTEPLFRMHGDNGTWWALPWPGSDCLVSPCLPACTEPTLWSADTDVGSTEICKG